MHRMRIRTMVDPLRRLLRRGARTHAANLLSKLHAADVARLLRYLGEDESEQVFALLLAEDPGRAGEVLSELEPADAVSYLEGRPDEEVAQILAEVGPDDAAEIVTALPEDIAARVLDQLERRGHEQVEDLLGYAEETAGRIMSTEVYALREDLTVSDAIEALRASGAEDLEMVFYLYVIDERGHLVGVCSLRDLLLRDASTELEKLMSSRVISVNVDTDQEEVAHLVARYNYLALPVVDHQNKLVGIITVDDIIDIIRDEETEDILLMAGVGEDEEQILTAPLWRNVMLRLPWLLVAWFGGVFASQILSHYQGMLSQVVALVFFIPIINGMGGNIGTQSSTIVVRAMATGKMPAGQTLAQVLRQQRVGLVLGLLFGALLGGGVYFLNPSSPALGLTVGLSLVVSMTLAATVGSLMPVVLRNFGVDPAIATGPFVTTSIDVLGITAYFAIASVLVFR